MLAVGARALNRHAGMVAVLFLVQVAIASFAGFMMTFALTEAFAHRPLFDEAVDGDLASLLEIARSHPDLLGSLLWIGIGTALIYFVVSWFLQGGLIATLLADKPAANRREAAERFGAGGAAAFWPYLKLAAWSLIPYTVFSILLFMALDDFTIALERALTWGPPRRAAAPLCAVAAVIGIITYTALDYARIDLQRHARLSAIRALLRSYKLVVLRPIALLHVAIYALIFIGVSALYVAISHGRPMLGAGGAISLFFVREAVALVRFVAHIALIGGQVELARVAQTRPERR
jgi:hypothetical protein